MRRSSRATASATACRWKACAGRSGSRARKGPSPAPRSPREVVATGDVVYVLPSGGDNALLAQVPDVQGAFIALDPHDGAMVAMSGGFDYQASKFNRVTQARRQPGSSFKPFVYSAALEAGFTPASIVLDAPVVYEIPASEDGTIERGGLAAGQ